MGFGISVNGNHEMEHNDRVRSAAEAFMVELEKIEGVRANLTGYVDGPKGHEHFQITLPRDRENEARLRKEQEAQAQFEAREAAKEARAEERAEAGAESKAEPASGAKRAPRARTPKQKAADKKAAAAEAKAERAEAAEVAAAENAEE